MNLVTVRDPVIVVRKYPAECVSYMRYIYIKNCNFPTKQLEQLARPVIMLLTYIFRHSCRVVKSAIHVYLPICPHKSAWLRLGSFS